MSFIAYAIVWLTGVLTGLWGLYGRYEFVKAQLKEDAKKENVWCWDEIRRLRATHALRINLESQ